jgi:hypothetical protein
VTSFDRHQLLDHDGSVVCRDPASLDMVQNRAGFWMTMQRDRVGIPAIRSRSPDGARHPSDAEKLLGGDTGSTPDARFGSLDMGMAKQTHIEELAPLCHVARPRRAPIER